MSGSEKSVFRNIYYLNEYFNSLVIQMNCQPLQLLSVQKCPLTSPEKFPPTSSSSLYRTHFSSRNITSIKEGSKTLCCSVWLFSVLFHYCWYSSIAFYSSFQMILYLR